MKAIAVGLLALGLSQAGFADQRVDQLSVNQKEVRNMLTKTVEPKQEEGKVQDVGGAFIYANDQKALAEWYKEKLGIELAYNAEEGNYHFEFHHGDAPGAFIVFAIIPAKGRLPTERNQFMINFRIDSFDSFIKRLKAKGVAIDRTQDYDYGRFGWIKDLEGNPIEFWQPK